MEGAPWETGHPPLGKESLQPATGARWRLGLRTTGSPSQILFPVQLQSYRVPGFEGSGSGVPRQAAPAFGREVTSRSALPAHYHFTRLVHTHDTSQAGAPKWENIFCGRILIFDVSKRALQLSSKQEGHCWVEGHDGPSKHPSVLLQVYGVFVEMSLNFI